MGYSPRPMSGALYLVSTPIGNPEDITLRALRILKEAAIVAAEDPQRTQTLFTYHRIETPVISYQNANKEEKAPVLVRKLEEGQSVALVCDAGTPVVVDPGAFLVQQALRHGIAVIPIPGPSAALAALSASGLSGDSFVLLGPVPHRAAMRRRLFHEMRAHPRTLILFEVPLRLDVTLKELRAALGNRRMALACNLTTSRERFSRGTISELLRSLASRPVDGDVTLVIEGCRPGRSRARKRKAPR